jgi:hypothetical protein
MIVIVKNQPFTYSLGNTTYYLYYNVQTKPHFGQDWTQLQSSVMQSNTDYTVITSYPQYPSSAQIDVQVQAFVGYPYLEKVSSDPFSYPANYGPYYYVPAIADIETSGWSNTQTVITPANNDTAISAPAIPPSSSPTLTPLSSTSTPAVPEFQTLIILPLFAVATLLSIVFVGKRIQKK